MKTIDDVLLTDKKVLVRVDFNVPLDENKKITDATRIIESLQTIDKIIDDGGIPILMSHLGRPKGMFNEKYSLKPVAEYLQNNLGYNVKFSSDCIGNVAEEIVNNAELGDVVLLENLRFHKEEESNDPEFSKQLASLGDIYINDAFGTAHRAHASTEGITHFFSDKLAGYLIQSEIKYLGKAITNPNRPLLAIIGGAKISGKIDVITNLIDSCNTILIGGGMAFTFYKAMGLEIGISLLESDKIDLAKSILDLAKSKNVNLLLPVDLVLAEKFSNEIETSISSFDSIPSNMMGLDIGPETIKLFNDEIIKAKTLIWNGPMGVFELSNFAAGTLAIAQALVEATKKGAISIVGGGDSVAAINQMNLKKYISHVSTGGGASLEFLEGKILPGLAALEN